MPEPRRLPILETVTEKSATFEVVNSLGVCCATFDSAERAFDFIRANGGDTDDESKMPRGRLHVEFSRLIEHRRSVSPPLAKRSLKVVK